MKRYNLPHACASYSADTVRLAMANSGDTLEPANFDQTVCNKAVLTLAVFLETMKALVSGSEPLDAGAHMRQGSKLCIAAGGKTASITVSEVS